MSPEQRCYKILQDSEYIRIPEENPSEIIEYFLKSADGCSWINPADPIQERQFETSLKNWFSQYSDELIEFAKQTPATINELTAPFKNVGLHTMDDQGFEGQIMSDGTYWRIIEGEPQYIFFKVSNEDLESRWQSRTEMIRMYLTKMYDKSTSKEESDSMMQKVQESQNAQEEIQTEITKRAHN